MDLETKYLKAFIKLLPEGESWEGLKVDWNPKQNPFVLMALWAAGIHERILEYYKGFFPGELKDLLPDWEEVFALSANSQKTLEERNFAVVTGLVARPGRTLSDLKRIADSSGFKTTVSKVKPFSVGSGRVNENLGPTYGGFQVGINHVGQPLTVVRYAFHFLVNVTEEMTGSDRLNLFDSIKRLRQAHLTFSIHFPNGETLLCTE